MKPQRASEAQEQYELEAKFLILADGVYRALLRLRRLAGFRVVKSKRESQRNVYWDTADRRLGRARCVLRIRRAGVRREITFKRSLIQRGSIAKRLELTAPWPKGRRMRLATAGARSRPLQQAAVLTGNRPLIPVLTLETSRRHLILSEAGSRVALDVDAVVVRRADGRIAGKRREVEVEALSGAVSTWAGAVKALRKRFGSGLRPCRDSKFQFGMQTLKSKLKK